jgi:hypothetical protein
MLMSNTPNEIRLLSDRIALLEQAMRDGFKNMQDGFQNMQDRFTDLSSRLDALEEKVDRRLKDTRPILEAIHADLRDLRHALTSQVAVLERAQFSLEDRMGRIEGRLPPA